MRKLAAITALVVGILMSVSAVVTCVVIHDRLSDQKSWSRRTPTAWPGTR